MGYHGEQSIESLLMQRCSRLMLALDDDATRFALSQLLGSDKSSSESRPALDFLSLSNLPIAERNTLP